MCVSRIDVVVLAAGSSVRFRADTGNNKLLEPLMGKRVLARVLDTVCPFAGRVIVVTGYDAERVGVLATAFPRIDLVYNPWYRLGMFSSIQAGVRRVRTPRFAVVPGDLAMLTRSAFDRVLRAAEASVVRPLWHGTPGHPVVMDSRVVPRILQMPCSAKMHEVHSYYDVQYVDLEDDSVARDIDTSSELAQLQM